MMRSMYSAVSSLKAHQTKMDVIGNNIANVNTVGFKASTVTFKEAFNQTLKGAGSPQADGLGGTNPMQIGLGADVAAIDVLHTRGAVERTDSPTDVMINGSGFFMVSDSQEGLVRNYTRAGNFKVDEEGNLVTVDGNYVLGYAADEEGNLGSAITGLQISKSEVYPAKVTDNVKLSGNLDADTEKIDNTANITLGKNIDDLVSADGNSPVARDITYSVYDELGGTHNVRIAMIKTDQNEYTAATVNDKNEITSTVGPLTFEDGKFKMLGTASEGKIQLAVNDSGITFESTSLAGTGATNLGANAVGTGNLPNGAGEFGFTMNLKDVTQFANKSSMSANLINGYKQGKLDSYAIGSTGEIVGTFSNAQKRVLGRIAIADFDNPAGLQKIGENMFTDTANSGQPLVGLPGASGFAQLNPGSLEMSNVDLGKEFTNMITTQRGFQANSRVISTTDQILEELVNLKR